jgi:cell division protein FtsA
MGNKRQHNLAKNPVVKTAPADYVFALDIGTRSVIGIVGLLDGEILRIQAVETAEHTKRAMIDGQIEDIEQVSKVARLVKERLEKRLGYTLKQVCVAAAGRALKTQKASYEIALQDSQSIDQELVCRLEAGAIEVAERQFEPGNSVDDQHTFYLVGYSVMEYLLDDYPISSLLDHKGKRIGVEVIATFLPREVVDSLYTTMHKTGLDVSSLTLEPIAAMNAAIPQQLRLLNLALVDIGAGTSDIAISKDGGVVAYTMATVAGDEVTEAIMKKYLLDFNAAEEIKLRISKEEDVSFKDILGFDHTMTSAQIRDDIQPVMRLLCNEIAQDIIKANGEPTSAVFLVGGGSKLQGMCAGVAECLKLEPNRVAIGGNNFMMHVSAPNLDITGPEFATPLGIAISAALNLISDSFSITLNGSKAKLFRSKKLTVLDVLLMNGFSYSQFISRSGQSIMIELNGEKKILYGGHPDVAKILINGADATISTLIKAGDAIEFTPAVPGKDAQPLLSEVVKFEPAGRVTFRDVSLIIGTHTRVNGLPALPDQKLNHHDQVETSQIVTLGDLIQATNYSADGKILLVNGHPENLDYQLSDGDHIEYANDAEPLAEESSQAESHDVPVKAPALEEPVPQEAAPEEAPTPEEAQSVGLIHFTLNGAPLELPIKPDHSPYVIIDMLNLVDIDLTKPQGRIIVIEVNGQDAAYLQNLEDGDNIDIHWGSPAN